jgi:hypothetical protein
MAFLQEIRDYKNCAIKNRFIEYIQDKTIPMENRWEVFLEAPSDWKNHESYIQHFDVEKKLISREISWYDDFYIEKNETVHMENVIERLEEDLEDFEKHGWTKDLISELKEEILQTNLGSFNYDW